MELTSEDKLNLSKSRVERLRRSQRDSEKLLEERSRELYAANKQLEEAQRNLETDIKQATYELNVVNKRLSRSLEEKSRLISAISHEIRTPLNAIIGLSELSSRSLPNGSIKQNLDVIFKSGNSMLTLLNEMMETMHIDIGMAKLTMSNVDMVDNISYINRLFAHQIETGSIEWRMKSYQGPRFLEFDVRRYNQVVNNLLSNAIKHTSEGFIELDIAFSGSHQPNKGVLVTRVIDSGKGISIDHQKEVFDLYKQVSPLNNRDKNGNVRSIGLGLPICKKICELMEGDIHCYSELGEGSEFYFTIPVLLSEDTTAKENENLDTRFFKDLKILIAEDNLLNKQVINAQLEELGVYDVQIVNNGEEALNQLSIADFDIVFLDIMMPVMGGEKTIVAIRNAEQRISNHYCIALTAASYKEKGEQLLALGFDEFLSKPLTLEVLRKALSQVLSQALSGKEKAGFEDFRRDLGERFERFFQKIAPTYLQDSKIKMQTLRLAIDNKDPQQIIFLAHTLKGESLAFNFSKLGELFQQLETVCEIEQQTSLFNRAHKEWLLCCSAIKEELKKIL